MSEAPPDEARDLRQRLGLTEEEWAATPDRVRELLRRVPDLEGEAERMRRVRRAVDALRLVWLEPLDRRLAAFIQAHAVWFCALFSLVYLSIHVFVLLGYLESFLDYEELDYGSLAKDLREGLIAWPGAYQYLEREGGGWPFAFWTVPFFTVFGPSLFALKLAGVALMAAGTWPWVDLARRIGGARAGITAALLWLLPFPFYMRMTFAAYAPATHLGTVIFSGLASWLAYRGLVDRTLSPARAAVGAGLAVGLGCFWAFSFWPIAIGLAVAVFALRPGRRFWWLSLAGAAPGLVLLLALCLIPLFLRYTPDPIGLITSWSWPDLLVHDDGGGDAPTVPVTIAGMAGELWNLLFTHFPHMAGFVPAVDAPDAFELYPAVLYYLLILGALAVVLVRFVRSGRRDVALVALMAPLPIYVSVYLVSGIYVQAPAFDQFRYFLPLVPFCFVAIACASGMGRHRFSALPIGVVPLAIVWLGAKSAGNVYDGDVFPTPYRAVKGYNHFYLLDQVDPALEGLSRAGRTDYPVLANRLGLLDATELAFDAPLLQPEVPDLDPALWPDYWEGFGSGLYLRLQIEEGEVERRLLDKRMRRLALETQDSLRGPLLRGFVLGAVRFPGVSPMAAVSYLRQLAWEEDDDALATVLRHAFGGFGQARSEPYLYERLVERVPSTYAVEVWAGAGRSFARWLLPGRDWPHEVRLPEWLDRIPSAMLSVFWASAAEERARLLEITRRFTESAPYTGLVEPRGNLPARPIGDH